MTEIERLQRSAPQLGPSIGEKALVFFVLMLSSGAFMNLTITAGEAQDESSGQATLQIVWVLIYLVTVVWIFRKCRPALKSMLHEVLLLAVLLLAVGSTAWSQNPDVSLHRGTALVLTCLVGVYFGYRFTLREQLRLLAGVCGTCIVGSLIFGVLGLGNAVDEGEGVAGWIGVFVQKNGLGRMMAFSIVIFLILAKSEDGKRNRFWFGAGLAFVLLLLSRSASSAIVLAAMLAFLMFCGPLRRNMARVVRAMLFAGMLSAAGLYWASYHFRDIMLFMGKDITLTGRLPLWILSAAMAVRKPWFGYGYNAFWLGPGSPSARIWAVIGWKPPHAHNGLLELWLELGIVGVVLFLLGFVAYVGRAIIFLRRQGTPEAVWPLCFLVFMFLSNLTESDFLSRGSIFWIVYVAIVVSMRHALPICPESHRIERSALPMPEGELA